MASKKKDQPKPTFPENTPKEIYLNVDHYGSYSQDDIYLDVETMVDEVGGDTDCVEAVVYIPSHRVRITQKPVVERI